MKKNLINNNGQQRLGETFNGGNSKENYLTLQSQLQRSGSLNNYKTPTQQKHTLKHFKEELKEHDVEWKNIKPTDERTM